MIKRYAGYSFLILVFIISFWAFDVLSKPPIKSKFYDFSDQMIDGEIRKPTALYTDARQKARFERLLKLKKSFLPQLFQSAKHKVFK